MSVYVDRAIEYAAEVRDYVGHPRTRPRWCHMIADTLEELHAMADQLGLKREWFQGDHYDIVPSKRTLAIKLGAQALDRRAFVAALTKARAAMPTRRRLLDDADQVLEILRPGPGLTGATTVPQGYGTTVAERIRVLVGLRAGVLTHEQREQLIADLRDLLDGAPRLTDEPAERWAAYCDYCGPLTDEPVDVQAAREAADVHVMRNETCAPKVRPWATLR